MASSYLTYFPDPNFIINPHGDEVYNIVTAFICTDYHGTLAFDKAEASAIQFFDLDKLPKEISLPDQVVLDAYVRGMNGLI